ncbi:protein chiffon isoform X2 [Drosophila hydei]|uniref:Protein chiffon isoform X2 n=1 Tax=Drosophila hydei TaxID=7224 RepID=A0A6J2SWF3_DROHY|nr:protein chiffon isoform X2 [Drosophila hydei]
MQPQSDKQSASKSKLATARASPQQQQQQPQPELQQQPHHRSKVKVIKSKRPLCHFKFYLDICDHQLAKRIEADIKALGGTLEFFLNDSITHFITDKENGSALGISEARRNSRSQPGTPLTQPTANSPHTPITPIANTHEDSNGLQRRTRQTRADAILSRVRGVQQITPIATEAHSIHRQQQQQIYHKNSQNCGRLTFATYTIWQTEYALRFFQRIQTELRQYLKGAASGTSGGSQTAGTTNIHLKGNYIKIESIKRNHRPYYHLLKQPDEWPKIDLCSEDSAFRLQTKAYVQSMTRRSLGSRTSQRQQDQQDQRHPQSVPVQHAAVQALKKQSVSVHTPDSPRSHCKELKESSDKQCGVCEICKIEYDTLTTHLQSKEHDLFAKNVHNFLALDTLIQVSASVTDFLKREQQKHRNHSRKEKEQTAAETNSDMEVDELLNNSTVALNTKSPNQSDSNAAQQSSNNNRQRPSPALREKSKRITKGKHSSEKFRATGNTSPNPLTPSPNKKITATCSLLELQRVEETANNATIAAATPSNPTRRKTQNSVLSPPIRAMLPPSSLYKVVEANDAVASSPRIRRGTTNVAGNVMDSPSLIVKFQKVRQSELQRLNGEAENFMFPRTTIRSSSELPTDVDRHTTSDARGHQSNSSPSSHSTSEVEIPGLTTPIKLQGRATAVGRRRKRPPPTQVQTALTQLQRQLSTGSSSSNGGGGVGGQQQQQRFPNAPIQPEMQPQLLSQKQATATRKSSRMATAIVTAATTSSQLQLRRRTESTLIVRRGSNMEDRMGEQTNSKKTEARPESDELEDEESNDESSSSGSDEDYVANGKLRRTMPATNRLDTREERAARRLSRLTISINRTAGDKLPPLAPATPENKSTRTRKCSRNRKPSIAKAKQSKQQTTPPTSAKKTLATELIFDCSKSERLKKLRYAFEKSPEADLWHRVFQRQDACEEHFYSYYGSTEYRKLPYELGPIPMDRTSAHSCTLCRGQQEHTEEEFKVQSLRPIKLERNRDLETEQIAAQSDSNQTVATTTSTTTSSMYRHKKMHLLQRYQQEQQQQQQTLNTAIPLPKCDSKASTPELLEREFASLTENAQVVELVRAASTQSNSSSSCSNSQNSNATCRNKQLARIAELPPRKSPREHASTLALVSCIIRQRQDSLSKTNSEVDEPGSAASVNIVAPILKLPLKQESVILSSNSHNTRSQAATPVEELRFATEISETVKRMRRGQNKYDTLPSTPALVAAKTPTITRCRRPTAAAAAAAAATSASFSSRLEYSGRDVTTKVLLSKRKRRQISSAPAMRLPQQQPPGSIGLVAGVRKLPSKKGILEYEMEASALKALDASIQYADPMLIAWKIDKYLELTGREYDFNSDEQMQFLQTAERYNEDVDFQMCTDAHTPPPTDFCFTSEFDLCDLLAASSGSGEDDEISGRSGCRRNSRMNLYCSYQRKRKCLKSNRTGWPRAQRRRAPVLSNAKLQSSERSSFRKLSIGESHEAQKLKDPKQEHIETEEEQTTTTTTTTTTDKEISKEQDDDKYEDGSGGAGSNREAAEREKPTRQATDMTPPATDVDEPVESGDYSGDEAAASVDNESQVDDDDDETMADSIDQVRDGKIEIEATDADVEEDDGEDDDDDDDDDDVFEDAFGGENIQHEELNVQNFSQSYVDEPEDKRIRIISESPANNSDENRSQKMSLLTLQTSNGYRLNATSTPSTQQTRQQQQRRTPQLNGSLGSCISPSEKLGDHSDVFTVSSDGLDTDMDLSNTQAGDSLEHCSHQRLQQTTPKRKFDLSKYAPPNNGMAASSCAAEAATAAVKSLAISQFLKKEVRVTCRRLRAPFRRFRYRR